MAEHILVSVTDHRPVTLKSFKLMLNSFRRTGNALLFDRRVILHPRKNVPRDFLCYLQENGVESYTVETDLAKDTYKIKLMLSGFIASCPRAETLVFYLDPDHLFLTHMDLAAFPPGPRTLYVSSEVSPLAKTSALTQDFGLEAFFNTSIIFGRVDAWNKVMEVLRDSYHAITSLVPSRHREEIAFSIAANRSGVDVKPVSRHFQGNFSLFTNHCCMFHYGGESEHAQRIKAHLVSAPDGSFPVTDMRLPASPEVRFLKQMMGPDIQ